MEPETLRIHVSFNISHGILDGLEKFSKTIPRKVNVYKNKIGCCPKTCGEHPDGLHTFFNTIQLAL